MKSNSDSTGQSHGQTQLASDSGRLEWFRWPSGFEIREIRPKDKGKLGIPYECLVRKNPHEKPTRYFPEDCDKEAILNDFTGIVGAKSALRFANRYGFLLYSRGTHQLDPDDPCSTARFQENAEVLDTWLERAERTRRLTGMWLEAKAKDPRKLQQYFGQSPEGSHFLILEREHGTPGIWPLTSPVDTVEQKAATLMRFVTIEMNYTLSKGFRGRMEIDKTGRPHLKLISTRLIDWVHLLIAHGMVEGPASVTNESERILSRKLYIRFCEECHYPLFARWSHRLMHTDCRWRREKREQRKPKTATQEVSDDGQASE